MFARTVRLTLRPGWPEDAAALARAIGHREVVSKLSHAPWPYGLGDASDFLALPRRPDEPCFLVLSHEHGYPEIVGGIAIGDEPGGPELGYWFTPAAWGRGYATEAGRAVVEMARHALGIARLHSGHFLDNPASGHVLAKLGFRPTGEIVHQPSRARGETVACVRFELDLHIREEVQMAA